MRPFFNVYKVKNVNVGGLGVKNRRKIANVVCERPLNCFSFHPIGAFMQDETMNRQ